MSFMFEVYYHAPADTRKEAALTAQVAKFGGHLSFREIPAANGPQNVCLTYEFDEHERARLAACALREQGEHVEGPVDYGE